MTILCWRKNTFNLQIGSVILSGCIKKLPNPVAILAKAEEGQWKVEGIITAKLLFNQRPKPLVKEGTEQPIKEKKSFF